MTNTANPELLEAPPSPATPGPAIFSFILGLLSVIGLMITGVPAIVFGHVALRRIKNSPIQLNGKNFALAGIIMGWLSVLATLILSTIIALGIMAIPKLAQGVNDASDQRASETALKLKSAIGAYHEQFGKFPFPDSPSTNNVFLSNETIMNQLMAEDPAGPFYSDDRGHLTLFTDPGSGLSKRGGKIRLVDPWGKPFRVKIINQTSGSYENWQNQILVWSTGRDKKDGTPDDIVAVLKSATPPLMGASITGE